MDLLAVELGDNPDRPEDTSAKAAVTKPKQRAVEADEGSVDARAQLDDESEEDYADRMAELDAAEADPRAQLEGESEEVYAERMAELDAAGEADPRAQLEGESEEVYAERMAELDAAGEGEEGKPKVPANLQKRFDQLTAKVHGAEREAAREKARAEAAERKLAAARPAPTSFEAQVQGATSQADLETLQAQFEEWEELAITHPDGYDYTPQGQTEPISYSGEQMRALLVNMRRALRAIPQQTRFLAESEAKDVEALKVYPAYKDPDSALSKAYAAVVERAPGLSRAVPDLRLFVADAMRGRALRTKPVAGPGKPLPRQGAVPTGAAPGRGRAPVVEQRAQRSAAALARLVEQGGADALAGVLESRFGG